MAEETKVEEYTEQESPTVEQEQPTEVSEEVTTVEAPESKEERNWKAVREELDQLKAENKKLKTEEKSPLANPRSEIDRLYLDSEENAVLQREEIKAELKFPELETKNLFSMAVFGEYRQALDNYNLQKSLGVKTQIPSVNEIAKKVKAEYDGKFGEVSKRSEIEGAKKAQQNVERKEATVEAEGRSDRARTISSTEEVARLRKGSQEGDINAVVQRLMKSKL